VDKNYILETLQMILELALATISRKCVELRTTWN